MQNFGMKTFCPNCKIMEIDISLNCGTIAGYCLRWDSGKDQEQFSIFPGPWIVLK
jgi:hypothetical protein